MPTTSRKMSRKQFLTATTTGLAALAAIACSSTLPANPTTAAAPGNPTAAAAPGNPTAAAAPGNPTAAAAPGNPTAAPTSAAAPAKPTVAPTTAAVVTPTAAPAPQAASNPATTPLKFIGWGYHPEIVESNVKTFKELYNENVEYDLIPASYYETAEARFIAGDRPHMLYSETSYMYRWWRAKFLQDVEEAKAFSQSTDWYKQNGYPSNVAEMSINGKLMGLSYYSGYIAFIYNKEHLAKANLKPAETWEELLQQCAQLQKDKISAHPFTMAWNNGSAGLSWSASAWFISQGEYLFDDSHNPTFKDGGVAYKQVIEWMKEMFDKGYAPPDGLVAPGESVPAFGTGEITYMLIHDYDQQALNTQPDKFKTAPNHVGNAIIPGTKRDTYSWTTMLLAGSGHSGPEFERTWNLLQFFGGKTKDNQWHGNKTWSLQTGLGSPWKPLNEDQEVLDSWGKWRDMKIHSQQLQQSKGRQIEQTMWYAEWDLFFQQEVGNYIQGKLKIEDVIKDTYDKAVQLKKQYPA